MEKKFLDAKSYLEFLPGICRLFERSFNRKTSPEYLTWRYLDNPINDVLACVKLDGSRVIASYSASPVVLTFEGKEILTALSMTTMTDPEFTGQGHFVDLANSLYAAMESKGYQAVWGFPNSNSHPGFVNRLGWKDVENVFTLELNLKNWDSDCDISATSDLSFKFDYENLFASDLLSVKKDSSYLRWRYQKNPTNTYENCVLLQGNQVVGLCVYKEYLGSLDLVELVAKTPDYLGQLLKSISAIGKRQNSEYLRCWLNPSHWSYNLLSEMGFLKSTHSTHLGIKFFKGFPNSTEALKYSQWMVSMGDSDVF